MRHGRLGETQSELDSAGQDLPPYTPVANETHERVAEGSQPVVLEEEMADPCERITLKQGQNQQPPMLAPQGHGDQEDGDAATCEVQAAGGPVRMLAEVERIELAKGAIGFVAGTCCALLG